MTETTTQWRNRIVRSGTANPADLSANPKNWRLHPATQQQEMVNVLDAIGWVRSVIVNERTGTIVDGHLRVAVALKNGETSIPVDYVDLSEDEESAVLATFDPLAELAASDHGKLRQLIQYTEAQGIDMEAIAAAFLRNHREADAEAIETGTRGFDADQSYDGVRDRYQQTPWRQIQLLMTNSEYGQIIRKFRDIARANDLKTNLDVFMWLVWRHEQTMHARKGKKA